MRAAPQKNGTALIYIWALLFQPGYAFRKSSMSWNSSVSSTSMLYFFRRAAKSAKAFATICLEYSWLERTFTTDT